MRGKILTDIIRQKREREKTLTYGEKEIERKRHEIKTVKELYDKPKKVKFKNRDGINIDDFRAIHKNIISYGLSKSALAVYPVLCSRADFKEDKPFQISQRNIAKLAGISENSVRKGIKELEDAELLYKEKITEKRRYYVYNINFIRESQLGKHKGKTVYFYTCIIHNGIWAKLKPRAKILYIAMRIKAKQDWKAYSYIEGDEYDGDFQGLNHTKYIQTRKWDICHLSISELCRIVGVERTNIKEVMDELEKFKLIERIDRWMKVYLRPERFINKPVNGKSPIKT